MLALLLLLMLVERVVHSVPGAARPTQVPAQAEVTAAGIGAGLEGSGGRRGRGQLEAEPAGSGSGRALVKVVHVVIGKHKLTPSRKEE